MDGGDNRLSVRKHVQRSAASARLKRNRATEDARASSLEAGSKDRCLLLVVILPLLTRPVSFLACLLDEPWNANDP